MKATDHSLVACHATKAEAAAQQRALYANEPRSESVTMTETAERSAPMTREATYPFQFTRDDTDDGLTLEGYASVFDSPTDIDDMAGQYREIVRRGAFTRSIKNRTPVLMFNHGRHPLIGPMPIGRFEELREDERGLYMRARLFDNWLILPLRDAIKHGAISGASFRFDVKRDSWSRPSGVRTRELQEVMVPELGPVVFPAYADAKVMIRSLYDYSETDFKLWTPDYPEAERAAEIHDDDRIDAEAFEAAQELRAKYSAEELRSMARSGAAMPDGSYPIGDAEDLRNAVRAVGRGGGSHDAIRRHIMKRARALGQSGMIPDNWNSDGSLRDDEHVETLDTAAGLATGTPAAVDTNGDDPQLQHSSPDNTPEGRAQMVRRIELQQRGVTRKE